MGKSVPDAVMNAALAEVATATLQSVVSDATTPTDLTGELASTAMVAGDGSGDYTIAQGDAGAGSRKLTMSAKSGVNVDHVVLSLSGTILLVTTCSGPDLTVGSNVDFPAWEYEIGVPS